MMTPDKDPTTFSLFTYLWVVCLSMWGGVVSFYKRVKTGEVAPHNIMEFVGEIVTSAFAGVVTFYLCEAADITPLLTAVFVAVTGHMGTRAIYLIEKVVEKRINKAMGE